LSTQNGCKFRAIYWRDRIPRMSPDVTVIGGGLAGSEAALQVADRGLDVRLFEMRPEVQTGAHRTAGLAELVCSNSLGSQLPDRASGILMAELDFMGCHLLECARRSSVPAGGALAVDRQAFSDAVGRLIEDNPRIEVVRREVKTLPRNGVVIVASGPLTSSALAESLAELTGADHLYFFDAISPIVEAGSIDLAVAFRASRYDRGQEEGGDYLNCPMDLREYERFVEALLSAERIELRTFEVAIREGVRAGSARFFEACLPVEVIAERGRDALAFGPMRPVGLRDPRTGRRPYAVVQLRQDDLAGELYNLVGFQTNLAYREQARVFRMIPGLEGARFARFGQMHRNTFVNAPRLLHETLRTRSSADIFFAGQLTGVEGYLGNIATGLLAGVNAARRVRSEAPLALPTETILGALCHYVSHAEAARFQPMKANLGLLPPLPDSQTRRHRRERAAAHAERSALRLREVWHATQLDCA
jgi:methylenetetrahydrofolate--tRNA-(uracil-5-)-methyltransferase